MASLLKSELSSTLASLNDPHNPTHYSRGRSTLSLQASLLPSLRGLLRQQPQRFAPRMPVELLLDWISDCYSKEGRGHSNAANASAPTGGANTARASSGVASTGAAEDLLGGVKHATHFGGDGESHGTDVNERAAVEEGV